MKGASRVLIGLLVLVLILAGGVAAMFVVIRSAARHVPSQALLSVDLHGPIPEVAPEVPFREFFGGTVLSRRDLRDALVEAARDPRIRAVRFRIDDLQAGIATVQELRSLVGAVADAGKDTSVFLESAGEFSPGTLPYYLASGFQRIGLGTLGDVNLVGLRADMPFLRGTFDKLEIEPDFPGIGAYKTARFLFIHKEPTTEQKEMTQWLLDSYTTQIATGIARGRSVKVEQAREWMEKGPFLGPDAKAAGLVDELTDWESFRDETEHTDGVKLEDVPISRYLRAGRPNSSGTPIAVVVAEGTIASGDSGYSPAPLFGGDIVGSRTMARAWQQVRQSGARAAIFRIDSPGGSAVASEAIRAEMARTAKQMPVVVSMGELAASGGYWITCGAKKIVADPGTLTASIGVFAGHFAMENFWNDKLGVTWGTVETTPNSGLFDSLQPWTPPQQVTVKKFLDRIYGDFVKHVSESRGMSPADVDAIGRGRVFTGAQAKERKLVDELGDFDVALAEARKLAGLAPDAPVDLVFYPRQEPLWKRLLGLAEDASRGQANVLRELVEGRARIPGPVWLPPILVR